MGSTRFLCSCCPKIFSAAMEMHVCIPCSHVICFDCAATMIDSRCPRCNARAMMVQPKMEEADHADVAQEEDKAREALQKMQDDVEELETLNQGLSMELNHIKQTKSIRSKAAANAVAEAKERLRKKEAELQIQSDDEVALKYMLQIEGKRIPYYLYSVAENKACNMAYVLRQIKKASSICKKKASSCRNRAIGFQKELDNYQKEMKVYNMTFEYIIKHCRENFSKAEMDKITQLYETSTGLLNS